jgi:hypothetical protein
MRLLFGKRVVDSVESYDRELSAYFQASTSLRSRARRGTVVVVDKSPALYQFLDMLVSRCNLKFCVYHVDDAKVARRVLAELGQENVKVVVINSDLLFASANGVTLSQWVNEQFPEIPVWISDCPPEKDKEIRKNSMRVGIIARGEPLKDYIEVLGFPSKCKTQAAAISIPA